VSVIKKSGSVFGSQWASVLISNAIAVMQLVFLTRTLGVESFGVYASYLGVFSIVLVIQEFGVRNLILGVDSATLHDYRFYEYLLILGLGLAVGLQLGLLLVGFQLVSSLSIGLCALSVAITSMVSTSLFAQGMLHKDAAFKVLLKSLVLASFVVLLSFSSRVEFLFVAWTVINVLISVVFIRYVAKTRAGSRLPMSDRAWISSLSIQSKTHLGRALRFNLVDLASAVYIRFGVITLACLGYPDASIGLFALALRFPELVIQLLTPVAYMALLRWKEGPVSLDRASVWVLLVGFVMVFVGGGFVLICFGGDLIAWIFGAGYRSTVDVLEVVYLAIPFMVFNLFAGHLLLARGHALEMFYIVTVACCVGYAVAMSSDGAAVARWGEILLLCEGVQAFLLFVYVKCFLRGGSAFSVAGPTKESV